jgi:hypothetical protein
MAFRWCNMYAKSLCLNDVSPWKALGTCV